MIKISVMGIGTDPEIRQPELKNIILIPNVSVIIFIFALKS